MKESNNFRIRHCCSIALVLFLGACGGGGGDGDSVPPANVAGIWTGPSLNPEEATLTDCTSSLSGLDGKTVQELETASAECSFSSPPTVSQSGSSLTFLRSDFTCDNGDYGYTSGGGTVSGNSLTFTRAFVSEAHNYTMTYHYSGTVDGPATVTLSEVGFRAREAARAHAASPQH